MNAPKIQLSDRLQGLIAEMQANDGEEAKEVVIKMEEWITRILTGNLLCDNSDPKETLSFLSTLNSIKLDYQKFIIKEGGEQ